MTRVNYVTIKFAVVVVVVFIVVDAVVSLSLCCCWCCVFILFRIFLFGSSQRRRQRSAVLYSASQIVKIKFCVCTACAVNISNFACANEMKTNCFVRHFYVFPHFGLIIVSVVRKSFSEFHVFKAPAACNKLL